VLGNLIVSRIEAARRNRRIRRHSSAPPANPSRRDSIIVPSINRTRIGSRFEQFERTLLTILSK